MVFTILPSSRPATSPPSPTGNLALQRSQASQNDDGLARDRSITPPCFTPTKKNEKSTLGVFGQLIIGQYRFRLASLSHLANLGGLAWFDSGFFFPFVDIFIWGRI